MAASATQNPAVKLESKSAKKKKAKAEAAVETSAPSAPEVAQSNNPADSNNGDGSYESPYIKELYKWVILLSAIPLAAGYHGCKI